MPRRPNIREKALEISEPKIVHMLVEDVEPGAALPNPVQTGHFNVDQSGTAIGGSQLHQKIKRPLDMLQHMSQDQPVRGQAGCWIECSPFDARVFAIVSGIETASIKTD